MRFSRPRNAVYLDRGVPGQDHTGGGSTGALAEHRRLPLQWGERAAAHPARLAAYAPTYPGGDSNWDRIAHPLDTQVRRRNRSDASIAPSVSRTRVSAGISSRLYPI